MKTKDIIEGNKLIAEFYKECIYLKKEDKKFLVCTGDKWKFPQTNEINKLYNNFPISDGNLGGLIDPDFTLLKFHTSWDWIMPVVMKCKKINIMAYNGSNISVSLLSLDLDKLWMSVVEFIKWYNDHLSSKNV